MVPWEDKRILCELLRQPYIIIPRGDWFAKPAVNECGLGIDAAPVRLREDHILQPLQRGEYLNVDLRAPREIHVWAASRVDTWFRWFCYLGPQERHLSPVQSGKAWRLYESLRGSSPVNVEFIGDYAIEAHARTSAELDACIAAWDEVEGEIYSISVWDDRPPTWPPGVNVYRWEPLEGETPVRGHTRSGVVTIEADGPEAANAFAAEVNPHIG